MTQIPVLVCASVEDLPEPMVASILTECMECTVPVWRSLRSLAQVEVVNTICVHCVAAADDVEVVPMLPSVRAEMIEGGWTLAETEALDRDAAQMFNRRR